jgi:CheY-like chemotaxis protein
MLPDQTVRTIVVADDDYDDQMLIQEVLGDFDPDLQIVILSDGVQLMEYLRTEKQPQLLLLDLNMPYKTGLECLTEIRVDESLKDLPVVILSTSKAARDVEQSYLSGANLFLSKPCTFEGLKKLLGGLLAINWQKFHTRINKRLFQLIATDGTLEPLFEEVR